MPLQQTGVLRPGSSAPRRGANRRASRAATRCFPQACVLATQDVYKQAGITDPRRQIDMAELYVPFSWYEAIWLEGHGIAEPGRRLAHDRQRGDRAQRSCSRSTRGRGALEQPHRCLRPAPRRRSGEPGRGMAGEHQVDGAKVALGMAYGAANQYFSTWIVSNSLQPFG